MFIVLYIILKLVINAIDYRGNIKPRGIIVVIGIGIYIGYIG